MIFELLAGTHLVLDATSEHLNTW